MKTVKWRLKLSRTPSLRMLQTPDTNWWQIGGGPSLPYTNMQCEPPLLSQFMCFAILLIYYVEYPHKPNIKIALSYPFSDFLHKIISNGWKSTETGTWGFSNRKVSHQIWRKGHKKDLEPKASCKLSDSEKCIVVKRGLRLHHLAAYFFSSDILRYESFDKKLYCWSQNENLLLGL